VVGPQSGDVGRSLLEFADGKELGESGVNWLRIHLANTFGMDKVSYSERESWVDDNEAKIRASAADPLSTLFWREADEPWKFLAACFEWNDFCAGGKKPKFKSHLPIAMDGTCNGLQHLSALARDEEGARLTNLEPGDTPQDIYKEVAVALKAKVEEEASGGQVEAAKWIDQDLVQNEDRKLTKGAVMKTPYGITADGIAKEIFVDLGFHDKFDQSQKACRYLAGKMLECIAQIAFQACCLKCWFQSVAGILAKKHLPAIWTTPRGLPVAVKERVVVKKRIANGMLTIWHVVDHSKINTAKQKVTIVSAFVHSLDAAHLMLTVNNLYSKRLRHFGVVHDSFAVHACDVDTLNTALREEFLKIHQQDLLGKFLLDLQMNAPGAPALPDKPGAGNFDIRKVMDSEYFFC
jgi:DNA-directed RNA polymerase